MKTLTSKDYSSLIDGARILQKDPYGIKVLLTPDNKIIKLFRHKNRLSSSTFYPYAKRFCDNAAQLKALNIASIHIEDIYNCPDEQRHVVVYPLLPGTTLDHLLATGMESSQLLQRFAGYYANLHNIGVYFRSLHLRNVIMQTDGEFGLIDVADMTVKRHSLGPWLRARNFKHMLRYKENLVYLQAFGFEKFLQYYYISGDMNVLQKQIFLKLLYFLVPDVVPAARQQHLDNR